MLFHDRADAARQLLPLLAPYAGRQPLVLAIPRGAVTMGAALARGLDGELDLVLVRKLRAPGAPELAVGAMDEAGWVYVAPHAGQFGADERWLAQEQAVALAELQRRRAAYTPGQEPAAVAGRVVIVVDDGLATGATMVAALHAVRLRQPARLVCAVPVASESGAALVRGIADEFACVRVAPRFEAVGRFYRWFPQVEDDEVIAVLRAERDRSDSRAAARAVAPPAG